MRYVDHSQQKQQQPYSFTSATKSDSKQPTGPGPGRDQSGQHVGLSSGASGCTSAMYEIVAQPTVEGAAAGAAHQQHPEAGQHDQQGKSLKSYFSDGDFSEVMIKINDHDDLNDQQQQQQRPRTPSQGNNCQQQPDEAGPGDAQWVKRRRSSCSDAGDSKRSSLSHDNVPF